jgi:phage-related protein
MRYEMKPIKWMGASRAAIRAFPRPARDIAGDELFRLQVGLDPEHWRPMSSIGAGIREIRISTGLEYRIVYVIEKASGPVVLHAFQKATPRTSRKDKEIARQRLREL